MTTIIINDNITAILTNKTAEAYYEEQKHEAEVKARYEAEAAEYRRLNEFYDKYIATATDEDYNIGYEIYSLGHELWRTLSDEVKATTEGYIFGGEALGVYVAEYVKRNPQISAERAIKAFEASEAYSFYSDWYKELNGVRPH